MMRKLIVVLLIGVICLLGVIPLWAQSQYATIEEYKELTGKSIVKFNEAPVLRTKVTAGELPSIEERVPEEPCVVEPVEEIGQYGGTLHRAWLGPSDKHGISALMIDCLVRRTRDGSKVIPNVAKAWKISDGGKVYTFYLRKGMKWSDGEPFTADDILFYYEDFLLNKDLTPVFPDYLTVAGEPGKVEKVDDYTIKIVFSKPYGLFLSQVANERIWQPKHYLRKFHPRYTPMKELEELTKKEGFKLWHQLFHAKADAGWWDTNTDYPTIRAWKVTVPVPAQRVILERNPYYWKVDTEGNQLPYIDRIVNDEVSNSEMINFKAMAGELDFQLRKIALSNYTLFMENKEKGDYRVLKWPGELGASPVIHLNQNCPDPVKRKLFQDVRFRQALSLAINRDEINELVFRGLGEPRQASIPTGGRYYSKEWEKAYAEYDPKKANAILDEMGLKWDKNREYRIMPNGKPLHLTVEIVAEWIDVMELVKDYWKAIGVNSPIKSEARSLFQIRGKGGQFEVSVWKLDRVDNFLKNPVKMIPVRQKYDFWAPLYGQWYQSEGKSGEEPTGDIRKLQELWDKIKATVDEEERDRLAREIVKLHTKNIWMIGTVGELPTLMIAKNNLRNVPGENLNFPLILHNAMAIQFFFKQK